MSDAIYLNLLGKVFKLSFKNEEREWDNFKNRFKNEIQSYFSLILIESKNSMKVDYYIDFYDPKLLRLVHADGDGKVYQHLFTFVNENRISCLFSISITQFRMILWSLFTRILNKNGGFVLHSSCVSVNGRAFLFLGDSGAGKSTTAALLSKFYPTLGDDTGIVVKENKKYYYYSTPFPEKIHWVRRDSTRYDIGKVFFVVKADYFKVEKIDDKEESLEKFVKQGMANEASESIPFMIDFVSGFNEFYYLYCNKKADKLYKIIKEVV